MRMESQLLEADVFFEPCLWIYNGGGRQLELSCCLWNELCLAESMNCCEISWLIRLWLKADKLSQIAVEFCGWVTLIFLLYKSSHSLHATITNINIKSGYLRVLCAATQEGLLRVFKYWQLKKWLLKKFLCAINLKRVIETNTHCQIKGGLFTGHAESKVVMYHSWF